MTQEFKILDTYCNAASNLWNFGSKSLMPLSNCTKLLYARTSGGVRMTSASKSRLLNRVVLHSLQSLTSTLTLPILDFSVEVSVPAKGQQRGKDRQFHRMTLTGYAQPNLN